MANVVQQKLIVVTIFVHAFKLADVQIAVPMYMPAVPQPVIAVPPPVVLSIQMPKPKPTTTTTTTTTTEGSNVAVAVPVPVPMAVQVAVPAAPPPVFCNAQPRPRSCPPCPPCICQPSCTPAFFSYCSSCHLKCRCRNPEAAPVPMPPNPPMPIPGPAYPIPVPIASAPLMAHPPVVVIPLPPSRPYSIQERKRKRKHRFPIPSTSSSSSDESSCDSGSNSDTSYFRSGKKFKRRHTRIYRRNADVASERDGDDTDLIKPVLSYVSENGKVHFETELSKKEAMEILGEEEIKTSDDKQTVKVDNGVLVYGNKRKSGRKYDQIILKDGVNVNHS